MIGLEDYKPVTLSLRQKFQDHYARFPQTHSEYMFTSIVSWTHYMPAYCLFRENVLLLMQIKDGQPQFRPPVGERNEHLLKEVLDMAKKEGGPCPVIAVEEPAREWIGSLYPSIRIAEDRDFFDYVYLSRDLAELPGKPYLTQRNHLNRFRKKYEYSVEQIAPANMEDTLRFLQRWCLWRDCESEPMLEAEREAILFCMEHYTEMGLSGIVLRIGGEIQALSVYEPINPETAVIHFEKALPDFEGIYPAINNEAAKILAEKYRYINRESDLGIAGLRTAKERLHPDHMEKVYFISREDM